MTNAAELLQSAGALLLDFDGPIAALMPPPANAEAADRARQPLRDLELPAAIATTTDHLGVLRYAIEHHPDRVHLVERNCTDVETEAARRCEAGPHALDLLRFAKRRDVPMAVVSNNAESAVRTFLDRKGWTDHVGAFACRTPDTVTRLKPSPYLVQLAAHLLRVDMTGAVLVGDSVSDVIAGKGAGVQTIGVAKNQRRRSELLKAGADVVIALGDRAALMAI